ncbi:MAG: arsenate reductase ArsC [bacterium]|nr:arsenate reductase ArsC [bacterium]
MRILVLCTGNSCRSQMVHGWLVHLLGDSDEIRSAGLEPQGVHPLAIKVMSEAGVDISLFSSNHVKEYLNEDFDYVITVCDNAAENCPTFPKESTRLHWPFPDPAAATGTEEEIVAFFRTVRDEIKKKTTEWAATL